MQRKYRIFNQQGVFNIFWKNWEKLTNQVSKGILDSSSFRTISNRTSQLNFKKLRWNCYNGQENSGNVEERCYEISSTQHKQSVFNFSIYSLKKGLRAPPCDKSKEIEQAHSFYQFQNGRSFPLEGNTSQSGLHVQDWPNRCICFCATKSQISNICEFQMKRSNLPVSLPLLWSGSSIQNI